MVGNRIKSGLLLVSFCCLLAACSEDEFSGAELSGQVSEEARSEALSKWARSCALCHVDGEGGAPRMGDKEAWSGRLKQGGPVLLSHMLEGYNRMPPLGYCMDCSEQDLMFLTAYMAGVLPND